MYNDKSHLTKEGLHIILNLRASLNNGLRYELALAFPLTVAVPRALVSEAKQIDCHRIAGFVSGDGTLKINYRVSKTHKAGYQISRVFEITPNSRDELLLRALIKQLGCGGYYYDITNNTGTLTVTKFSDI